MKVPEPVRKFYDFFPLYTYYTPSSPSQKDTLYVYTLESNDPDCLLAKSILTNYNVPFTQKEASPYITPRGKLPVFHSQGVFDLADIIANYVPKQDREPVLEAVVTKVKNAFLSMIELDTIRDHYQTVTDRQRLWPLNTVIGKQVTEEVKVTKGYLKTDTKELEIALEALNEVVLDRKSIKLFDLMLYAVCRPLDSLVELPRQVQRHMLHVYDHLHPENDDEVSITYSPNETPDVTPAFEPQYQEDDETSTPELVSLSNNAAESVVIL